MNWLIAEDEADIRNLVSMMATVWGHVPMTFETGQKVWDWMDKIEAGQHSGPLPEFALMDIRMPGKRGNEIALRMRSLDQLKHIAIVLMTAFALSDDEMKHMRAEFGVDHIINKPLPDFDKLRTLLNDIIQKKAADMARAAASAPTAVKKPAEVASAIAEAVADAAAPAEIDASGESPTRPNAAVTTEPKDTAAPEKSHSGETQTPPTAPADSPVSPAPTTDDSKGS